LQADSELESESISAQTRLSQCVRMFQLEFYPIHSELIAHNHSREKKRRKNQFDVCEAVHESEHQRVKKPIDTRTKESIKAAHNFEVFLEPDNFTEEKCAMAVFFCLRDADQAIFRYKLFEHYQRAVHHESSSKSSFKRFLCSGLKRSILVEDGKEKKIGSYHQCYWLDGKLVAMGVLDLLSHCVSSVYLM